MVTRKAVIGVASHSLIEADCLRITCALKYTGTEAPGLVRLKPVVKTYPQSLANEGLWSCDSNEVAGDDCQVEVSCVPHQLIPAPGWW